MPGPFSSELCIVEAMLGYGTRDTGSFFQNRLCFKILQVLTQGTGWDGLWAHQDVTLNCYWGDQVPKQ